MGMDEVQATMSEHKMIIDSGSSPKKAKKYDLKIKIGTNAVKSDKLNGVTLKYFYSA